MRFLTKLSNRYFRWPTAFTLRIYAYLAAFFTVTSTVEAVWRVTAHQGFLHGLAMGAINVGLCAFLTLAFLLVWGLYYRLATSFLLGAISFFRGIPGAWYSFRRGCFRLGCALQDCAYGVVNFFRDLPANWRRKNGKQKADAVINITIMAIWIGSTVAVYPLAHRLSIASPHWMPMSDAPLLQTLFYDLVLGSFAMVGICIVVSLLLCAAHYLMRGRK